MKRCPECRRDYYDDTLLYCLDDGNALLEGPATADEPATAILSEAAAFRSGDATAIFNRNDNVLHAVAANSIAVLPFVHLSNQPDDEFFCDGLAEELINALTKIESLKVAARTSAFSFKGTNTKASEIGAALGVTKILEGSVRKAGDHVRITVQLADAADGYHIWSERYDREMKDIFAVQDEITLAVVEALKVKLLGDERSAILKKGTQNSEAFELYLRGRALWSRRTHADFQKAIEYFERAIEIDPAYTLAFVGLADCYSFLAYFEAYSPAEMAPKAKAAVEKAMTLDPTLAECHSSLALYKCFFELDVKGAERELLRAIEISPNSAVARYMRCSHLVALGRSDEAIGEGRLALKMDPLSPVVNVSLCRALCVAGLYEEAIDLSNRNFEILPDFFFSHWMLGWAYRRTGRLEEAIYHFRMATTGGGFTAFGYLGEAFVKAGRMDEARALLDELKQQRSELSFVSPVGSAVIHAALGETAEALELLEQAWQIRSIHLMWHKVDPIFEVFRSEPGFDSLLKRLNSSIKV